MGQVMMWNWCIKENDLSNFIIRSSYDITWIFDSILNVKGVVQMYFLQLINCALESSALLLQSILFWLSAVVNMLDSMWAKRHYRPLLCIVCEPWTYMWCIILWCVCVCPVMSDVLCREHLQQTWWMAVGVKKTFLFKLSLGKKFKLFYFVLFIKGR